MQAVEIEPLTEFFDAVRSPVTKDRYKKRLDFFFRHVGVEGSDLETGRGNLLGSPERITSGPPGRLTTTCESKKTRRKEGDLGIYCP